METFSRWAILVKIVNESQSKGHPVGHTFMQKLTYLLQNALQIELGYSFRIHYYGPYSEEVWQDLRILDELKILNVTPQKDGYGYSITLGENSALFNRDGSAIPGDAISKLVEVLGGCDVKVLEIIATTHYAYSFLASNKLEESKLAEETTKAVTALKPHIHPNQVSTAIGIMKELAWI